MVVKDSNPTLLQYVCKGSEPNCGRKLHIQADEYRATHALYFKKRFGGCHILVMYNVCTNLPTVQNKGVLIALIFGPAGTICASFLYLLALQQF